MTGTAADPTRLMVGSRYLVDLRNRQASVSGCETYRAADTLTPGAALLGLAPTYPPENFTEYAALRHPALMPIIAFDTPEGALWAISHAPPGPPILGKDALPWRESQVVEGCVRPFADLLQTLDNAELVARAIRPDTVFLVPGAHQVALAPLGLSPPGLHQPILFEPLSSAVCAPIGRGRGTIADDMFSLGVLILSLLTGRLPLAGLSDAEILQRRFENGSFLAYTEGLKMPAALASLVAALLSDDPNLRPAPGDLINISQRTIFSTPPDVYARRPLMMDGTPVRTLRALAWEATRKPQVFSGLMQGRVIERWLKTEMEKGGIVSAIERAGADMPLENAAGLSHQQDSATPVFSRIVALLDPDAPLYLGGRWFWPQALPTMLAYAQSTHALAGRTDRNPDEHQLTSILSFLVAQGESFRRGMPPAISQQIGSLVQRVRRSSLQGRDRVLRLAFDENPWVPCPSNACADRRICTPHGLLVWLEGTKTPPAIPAGQGGLLDASMRVFLESHAQRRSIPIPSQSTRAKMPHWLADLALLGAIQKRFGLAALPVLAARALPEALARLESWRSLELRNTRMQELRLAAENGQLTIFHDLLADERSLNADIQGAAAAEAKLAQIEARLGTLAGLNPRAEAGYRELGNLVSLVAGIIAALIGCWLELLSGFLQ